jgi:hypothetical protein
MVDPQKRRKSRLMDSPSWRYIVPIGVGGGGGDDDDDRRILFSNRVRRTG